MRSPSDKFKIHAYSGLIDSLREISNIPGVFKIVIDSSSILALISRCKDDSVNIRSRSIRLSHLRYTTLVGHKAGEIKIDVFSECWRYDAI